MRVWYCICLLFFIYSNWVLFSERNEVTFGYRNEKNDFEILGCFNLNAIKFLRNKTTISLDNLDHTLLEYFKLFKPEEFLIKVFEEKFLGKIKSKRYFIFRNQICIRGFNGDTHTFIRSFFEKMFKFYKTFVYDEISYRFYEIDNHNPIVDHLSVYQKPYPFSNCLSGYSKFICLNNCIKRKQRLSKYYYEPTEYGSIILSYTDNHTIIDNERKCSKKCKYDNCKLYFLKQKYIAEESRSASLQAYKKISTLDYFLQSVGLSCLFFANSLYQQLTKFKKLSFRAEKHDFLSKIIILLVCSILYSYFCFKLIESYNDKTYNPQRKEVTVHPFSTEPLTFMYCVHVSDIYSKLNMDYDKYYHRTMLEIEQDTDPGYKLYVDSLSFYLNFQDRKQQIHHEVINETIFMNLELFFFRCFKINLYPKPTNLENYLAVSKIEFSSNHHGRFYLYILSIDEKMNSKSLNLNENFFLKNIIKRKIKRSRPRCIDYRSKNHKLKRRQNYIDMCAGKKFIEAYGNISVYSFIDKDFYNHFEWSNLYLDPHLYTNQFNYKNEIYNFEKECDKNYPEADCEETYYESILLLAHRISGTIFDLNYDIISLTDDIPPISKLILDILNLESILFGYNVKKIINRFKIKNRQIHRFLIYSLNVLFSFHFYFLINEIVFGELIQSEHYHLAQSMKAPELFFCREIDIKNFIDDHKRNKSTYHMMQNIKNDIENHKMTFKYLEHLTDKHLNVNSIFKKIIYLDNLNRWITLEPNSSFMDKHLKIDTFYFENKKCFSIQLNLKYELSQFHFSKNDKILGIFFTKKFIHASQYVYFFTKPIKTYEFSKINSLYISPMSSNKSTTTITNENLKIIYKDKFYRLRNPLSLFYKSIDLDEYVKSLINNFERYYNLGSLVLPFNDKNLEIDVYGLFDQYNSQIHNVSGGISISENYQRAFATNYVKFNRYNLDKGIKDENEDFKFRVEFIEKIIQIENEYNFCKLIINLLNLGSLWLNVAILELYAPLYKIKIIFNFTFKLLQNIKKNLIKSLLFVNGYNNEDKIDTHLP